jgi:hypothetical protein
LITLIINVHLFRAKGAKRSCLLALPPFRLLECVTLNHLQDNNNQQRLYLTNQARAPL